MKKILCFVLALTMCLGLFAACGSKAPAADAPATNAPAAEAPAAEAPAADENPLAGTYDITMWVSEKEGVAAQFQEQIAAFMAENPGVVINATIEGVTEADAGSKVIADVESAPDIYCFAQDQMARLVQAAALAEPGQGAQETIAANNDAGSVAASKVAGTIYAYPMTSDNGYYMYYNTAVITNPEDLAAIVADAEAANLKVRYALENAWYTASFFFATGCHSNWTMDMDGNYTSVDDTFNSEAGLIAMKGMQILTSSPAYDSNADIFTDAAVVVTGIWNADAAAEHFGENLGVCKLPTFTVDGQTYQLGSYSGFKLMGVKPQTDPKRAAVLSKLALYLTNEQCQLARFEAFEWGPSNIAAQASEGVQANESLAALAAQNAFGTPQGQIHGAWWDIAKLLGADAKAATSEDDLKAALQEYEDTISALFSMTEEQKNAFSVIGSICGTNWDTDIPMTEDPAGTWTSDVLELHAGEEFKVRQGAAWDVNFGVNGEPGGANIVVEADGNYRVQLIWDGTTAIVNLIAE